MEHGAVCTFFGGAWPAAGEAAATNPSTQAAAVVTVLGIGALVCALVPCLLLCAVAVQPEYAAAPLPLLVASHR